VYRELGYNVRKSNPVHTRYEVFTRLYFNPEDGGDMFLLPLKFNCIHGAIMQKIQLFKIYAVLYMYTVVFWAKGLHRRAAV
jgi:hypothetical protein